MILQHTTSSAQVIPLPLQKRTHQSAMPSTLIVGIARLRD